MLKKRELYYIRFSFLYEDCDMIDYITNRECTSLDNMLDYIYTFLINRVLDMKLGKLISIEIYKDDYKSDCLIYIDVCF